MFDDEEIREAQQEEQRNPGQKSKPPKIDRKLLAEMQSLALRYRTRIMQVLRKIGISDASPRFAALVKLSARPADHLRSEPAELSPLFLSQLGWKRIEVLLQDQGGAFSGQIKLGFSFAHGLGTTFNLHLTTDCMQNDCRFPIIGRLGMLLATGRVLR
jgi:hypothetical protein